MHGGEESMKESRNVTPERVLVVVAHPDDAEFSCGGTVCKWTRGGSEIRYIVASSGNKGTKDLSITPYKLAEIREEEQREAARVLGVKEVTFLRHNDGELEVSLAFRAEIALLIRHFQPTVLLTHDPWRLYQIHPDHRAVGFTTIDSVVAARDYLFLPGVTAIGLGPHAPGEIYLFSTDNPDFFVDISETMDLKLKALSMHESQVNRIPDWHDRVKQWGSMAGQRAGLPYAEAFKRIILY